MRILTTILLLLGLNLSAATYTNAIALSAKSEVSTLELTNLVVVITGTTQGVHLVQKQVFLGPLTNTPAYLASNNTFTGNTIMSGTLTVNGGTNLFDHANLPTNAVTVNVSGETVGAGTAYSVPDTNYNAIDFGTTDPIVTLPATGTYLLLYTITIDSEASGVNDLYYAKVYNTTDAADVANSEAHVECPASSVNFTMTQHALVTVAASKAMRLYLKNATGTRGELEAARTKLTYIKLTQ